jgi:hypothetical protein
MLFNSFNSFNKGGRHAITSANSIPQHRSVCGGNGANQKIGGHPGPTISKDHDLPGQG